MPDKLQKNKLSYISLEVREGGLVRHKNCIMQLCMARYYIFNFTDILNNHIFIKK